MPSFPIKERSDNGRAGRIQRLCALITNGGKSSKFHFQHAWVKDDEGHPILSLEPDDLLQDGYTKYKEWFASRKTLLEALYIEQEQLLLYDPATHPTAKWLAFSFPAPSPDSIHFEIADCITLSQLMYIIDFKTDTTSPGPSAMRIGVLQNCDEAVITALLRILNLCILNGKVPRNWKRILMVPIPKTDSTSSLDDTRPIALMEVALKILTKIISNRTLHAWVANKRLESSQYAFLPGVSTADPLQIARCIFELSNSRVKQQILQSEDGEALSSAVHVAYIDIRRAYDSIEPWALALALRSLGVPAQIVTLMADIDKDCSLTVETQFGNTPDTPMGRGCKQGDPFSCLRFNAFINGLLRHLKTIPHAWRITPTLSSQGQAFADDTMLIADSHVGLQALSSATHEFLSFFCIDMAAQKSFHSSNSPDPPQHLYYGNEIIPFVDASVPVKYLGFHIAIDLNWQHTIQLISDQIEMAAATLRSAKITAFEAVTILNAVIGGKLQYLLQIINPPPATLAKWDSILLSIPVLKSGAGAQQPRAQYWIPTNQGGYGLRLPSDLEASISLSNFMYRLATDSLVGQLTRIRLEDYSRDAGYATCALRHPAISTASSKATQVPNHVEHINRILYNLKFSLDTDEINLSDQYNHIDFEIADILPAHARHKLMTSIAFHGIYFLGQITTSDCKHLIPYHDLRKKFPTIPAREASADWYVCIRELTTGNRSGKLDITPKYIPNLHSNKHLHPAFQYPAARGMDNRMDPYDLTQPTPNQAAITAPGRPQVWTSDGSLRRKLNQPHAGTALVGVQNAMKIFLTHLAGH